MFVVALLAVSGELVRGDFNTQFRRTSAVRLSLGTESNQPTSLRKRGDLSHVPSPQVVRAREIDRQLSGLAATLRKSLDHSMSPLPGFPGLDNETVAHFRARALSHIVAFGDSTTEYTCLFGLRPALNLFGTKGACRNEVLQIGSLRQGWDQAALCSNATDAASLMCVVIITRPASASLHMPS